MTRGFAILILVAGCGEGKKSQPCEVDPNARPDCPKDGAHDTAPLNDISQADTQCGGLHEQCCTSGCQNVAGVQLVCCPNVPLDSCETDCGMPDMVTDDACGHPPDSDGLCGQHGQACCTAGGPPCSNGLTCCMNCLHPSTCLSAAECNSPCVLEGDPCCCAGGMCHCDGLACCADALCHATCP